MRLLHLSDTHLHDPQWSTYHPEIDSAARLDAVLAATREHGPFDAIVLTGDVTDDYSVVGALAVHERLTAAYPGVPLLVVPGNHDLTESVREVFPTLRHVQGVEGRRGRHQRAGPDRGRGRGDGRGAR